MYLAWSLLCIFALINQINLVCARFVHLVFSNVLCIRLVILSMALCLLSFGSRSVLLSMTIMREQVSCPIRRHSAVCVCIPFTTSTTNSIRSMIWAPKQNTKNIIIQNNTDYFVFVGCFFWDPQSIFWILFIMFYALPDSTLSVYPGLGITQQFTDLCLLVDGCFQFT